MIQIAFLIFWFLVFSSQQTDAAVYWTTKSSDGSQHCFDTGNPNSPPASPGTQSSLTIAQGISCLKSGDTLVIRTGTYTEGISGSQFAGKNGLGFAANPAGLPSWGNINTPTTIRAYQSEVVTLSPSSGSSINFNDNTFSPIYILFQGDPLAKNFRMTRGIHIGQDGNTQNVHHIKFDGIDVRNTTPAPDNSAVVTFVTCVRNSGHPNDCGANLATSGSTNSVTDHIWITNSAIHDTNPVTCTAPVVCTSYGIYQNGASDIVVELTEFYNTSGYGIHQIYGRSNNNIYRFLYMHDLGQGGVSTGCEFQVPRTCAPEFAILISGDPDDTANTGNNNQVYGNLIVDSMNGISLARKNNAAYNNTLYRIGNGRVLCERAVINQDYCWAPIVNSDTTTGVNYIKNNIVNGNRYDQIDDYSSGATGDITRNFFTNPSFISPSAPSCAGTNCTGFYLNPGSGAINFGVASISPTITIPTCGSPICYNGSSPDAGAYETGVAVVNANPVINLVTPTNQNQYPSNSATLTCPGSTCVSGNASDDGIVTSVTWTCDRPGAPLACGSGNATNTGTNFSTWNIGSITLKPGVNNISIVATDNGSPPLSTTFPWVVTYAPTFPGNTLAGAWPFTELSGTTVNDVSGNNNNGNLNAGGTRVAGLLTDKAVFLNGTTQDITVLNSNSLNFTQSFTLSAWVNPSSLTGFRALISSNYSIALYASGDTSCGSSTPGAYFYVNGGTTPFEVCSGKPLATGSWSHVAVTYNGPNPGSTFQLYVNGVAITGTGSVAASGYIEPPLQTWQIGASQFTGENLAGLISRPRVYNFALPLAGLSNKVAGAACTTQNWNDNLLPKGTPSIIGDMNCPISPITTPLPILVPASPTGLQTSASSNALNFGTQ